MNKRVLIIEDSPTQATLLLQGFDQSNFTVNTVGTGRDGLRLAFEQNPDLIVLDLQLPDLSGFEVCRLLKSNLLLHSVPIVIYSQDNQLRNKHKAYESGADYYIEKSEQSNRTLQDLISTIMTRRRRRLYHSA